MKRRKKHHRGKKRKTVKARPPLAAAPVPTAPALSPPPPPEIEPVTPIVSMSRPIVKPPPSVAAPETFDYYISTTGSDANPGTLASPWAITAINTKRATYAQKRVGLLDGTYDLSSMIAGADYDRPCLEVANGTNANRTVIKAVNARMAILSGGASLPTKEVGAIGQGASGTPQGGYFTIDSIVIDNFQALGGCGWYSGGAGVQGITVQNCEIRNIRNSATSMGNNCGAWRGQGCTGTIIRNNYFHDIYGGNSTENEGYGVITFNCNDWVIEYNTIKLCEHGVYMKQTAQGCHTVRYNYIDVSGKSGGATPLHEMNGTGTPSNSPNLIYNNILVGTAEWDLVDFGTPGTRPMTLYNNSIYTPSADHGIYMPRNAAVNFYNNIMYIAAGVTVHFEGEIARTRESMTGNANDYNCWTAAAASTARIGLCDLASYASITKYTLAQVQAEGFETHSIAADPLFASSTPSSPADFVLQGGSPCKNTGKSDGTSGGSNVDMGAWGGASPPSRIGCDFA